MPERSKSDIAYANAEFIPEGEAYPGRWAAAAAAFRDGVKLKELAVPYGAAPRQSYDMYHPDELAHGTVIFIHGGYWLRFDPHDFSHLGRGALDAGLCFVMPRYTLAPDARIGAIAREAAEAVAAIAQRTTGPLYLVGHSAGGHLVARVMCSDLAGEWASRVQRVLSISPVSDLAPLMATSMNADLRIDAEEAKAESPIDHAAPTARVTVWVGADERPVFLDQAQWLVAAWKAHHVVDEGRHHFDVIEGLEDHRSEMMAHLLS
ncbi:MAG: alpha/beta hydrolase [Pseudomonadota bacterium]